MKKIFILSLLPLFTISCKMNRGGSKSTSTSGDKSEGITSLSSPSSSEYVDPYKMSKEQFEEQMNRDYVLTEANYYIEMKVNDTLYQYSEIGTGRMHSYFYQNQTHYYGGFEIISEDLYKYTMFSPTGERTYDYYPKETVYSYVFGDNGFYFDIPYEAYTYDESKHIYTARYQEYAWSEVVEMELHAINHLPKKLVAIKNNMKYEMEFSRYGEIKVLFPDEQN